MPEDPSLGVAIRARLHLGARRQQALATLRAARARNTGRLERPGERLRILYLSCHAVLEYDEVSLLRALGHSVFSPGAPHPGPPAGPVGLRESLPLTDTAELEDQAYFASLGPDVARNKANLPGWFVDRFDVVIVMHAHEWIQYNWQAMRRRPVIWRTIGQSTTLLEKLLRPYRKRGLKILRYSPAEERLPSYLGADALIRFYKDPDEYYGWIGRRAEILSINQSLPARARHCHYAVFQATSAGLPVRLLGGGNEAAGPVSAGQVSHEALKQALRDFRCFLALGTFPASYTLGFIEAWMTGTPVVALGNALMYQGFRGPYLYEVPELIEQGISGFYADSVAELRALLAELLRDESLARRISHEGRSAAIRLFGKELIQEQWRQFLAAL
jgi:glycosyltransferase involved in cell wall biosynthesis